MNGQYTIPYHTTRDAHPSQVLRHIVGEKIYCMLRSYAIVWTALLYVFNLAEYFLWKLSIFDVWYWNFYPAVLTERTVWTCFRLPYIHIWSFLFYLIRLPKIDYLLLLQPNVYATGYCLPQRRWYSRMVATLLLILIHYMNLYTLRQTELSNKELRSTWKK